MKTKASQENIDRAYEYLLKTSKVFRNLPMDAQGELSIKLAEKLTEQEK
jgi:hypothetical protein